jgi:hypothetical protein
VDWSILGVGVKRKGGGGKLKSKNEGKRRTAAEAAA